MLYSVICYDPLAQAFRIVGSGLFLKRAKRRARRFKRDKLAITCSDQDAYIILLQRTLAGYDSYRSEAALPEPPFIRAQSLPAEEENDEEHGELPESVIVVGAGPYPRDDFVSCLTGKGITVCQSSDDNVDVLLVGTHDWTEGELDMLLDARRGRHLRVYSQEMFLAFIATGDDPYQNEQLLLAFGEGHPALEYLSEHGFDWPHTTIVPSRQAGTAMTGDWPQVGLLKYYGYTVGIWGKDREERHRILSFIFTSEVVNVESVEYMAKWGKPGSSIRLQQTAIEIASFVRTAKRRSRPPLTAIEHWEEDLAWLKQTHYHGRFTFSWPSTYVRL